MHLLSQDRDPRPGNAAAPIDMAKDLSGSLTRQFQFIGFNDWFFSDTFDSVGSISQFEILSARIQVSRDGKRLEFGALRSDIDEMLDSARIIMPNVQTSDAFFEFW